MSLLLECPRGEKEAPRRDIADLDLGRKGLGDDGNRQCGFPARLLCFRDLSHDREDRIAAPVGKQEQAPFSAKKNGASAHISEI